jgi:hypothetical protein
MAEDRWYDVALPILEYVHAHGGPLDLLSVADIAEGTGLSPQDVAVELDSLCQAGFVNGTLRKMMTGGDPSPWFLESSSLGERGLRVVGAWPSDDAFEALVAILDRQIAATADPEKISKLSALRSSVADVGKATFAGLLVEFAKGNIHF